MKNVPQAETRLRTFYFANLYTVISTNVVDSKHEAKRQELEFTWDFHE